MKKPIVAVAAGAGVFALVAAAAATLTAAGSGPAAGSVDSACTSEALLEWEYILENSLEEGSNVGWIESVEVTTEMTALGCTQVRVYLLDDTGNTIDFTNQELADYTLGDSLSTIVEFSEPDGVDPEPVESVRVVIS